MAENVSIVIKAFDKTKPAFGAVGKSLKGVTSAIFSMRTALIGVAGVAGFGYLIKSSLNATDTLSKTANKIGTTTEALGGLRYAAEITGVATNTMDMALQRFTRRTAEAAKGTGEAKGAIKELGLNAQELNKMPLDQRMIALADAFGKVDNESDQLRLAFKLFDSEGAALVNTLALGSDGLKELLGEAKLLGLTMSTAAAQGVEKANDSITKLLSLGKGLRDQFAAALAPAIETMVKAFTAYILKIQEAKGGIEAFAKSMAVSFLNGVKAVILSLDTMLGTVSKFFNKATGFIKKFDKNATLDSIAHANKQVKELNDEITVLQAAGKTKGLQQKADKISELLLRIAKEEAHLARMNETFPTLSLGDLINMEGVEETFTALIAGINGIGTAVTETLKPAVEPLNDLQQGFKDWSDALPDTTANIKSLTNQGLNGLTDALTAGVTGAANFADAMKSMAKSVIDSLIKMLIQKYIVDAAFGAITGFISNTQAGINSSAGYSAGMGDPFASNFGGKAIGGSVQNGQPYMVGERGPEMFVPNSQGSIVPNNRMGGGGGVVVNQTINVTTGVQQTVRAEIASLMPQIANAAKGAVADAKMRGGNYSKMLGA
jgi:hypothetical protein|tara:strand:- start:6503 stop:8317 length:1815 start_codon:yes stop_codon:yes gene_type:complete